MRRLTTVVALVTIGVWLAATLAVVRLADLLPGARIEIAGRRAFTVDAATRERLRGSTETITVTYRVSPPEALPAAMRHMARDVTRILQSLAAASGGRLRYEVLHPADGGDQEALAIRDRAAPYRMRTVTRDGHDERLVWSSLTVAHGPRPVATINGIEPRHLPRVQSLILAWADRADAPSRPTFAVAGAGTAQLAAALSRSGEVIEVESPRAGTADTRSLRIPDRADVLFLVDPESIDAASLREVERFVDRGGSVVVAGSRRSLRTAPAAAPISADEAAPRLLDAVRVPYGLESLLAAFGLESVPDVLLDTVAGRFERAGDGEQPFLVRAMPSNLRFDQLAEPVSGNLLFALPTPIVPSSERGVRDGWNAVVLATSSDRSRLLAVDTESIPAERLASGFVRAAPAPKQAIAIALRPDDPWRGTIIILGASTPLRDEGLVLEGYAHRRMLEVILGAVASEERLIAAEVIAQHAAPLEEFPAGTRALWRGVGVGLPAAALIVVAVVRMRRRDRDRREDPRAPAGAGRLAVRRAAVTAAIALAAIVTGAGLAQVPGRIDLTAAGIHTIPAGIVALAREVAAENGRIRVIFSDPASLPPRLRGPVREAESVMRTIARRGGMRFERVAPRSLDASGIARLEAIGAGPVAFTDREEEVTRVRRAWCSVLFESGGRTAVVRFADPSALAQVELRAMLALRRVRDGRAPLVALASDVPRLTPAEAHELFQQRGLIAPTGADPYARARRLLIDAGFDVVHPDPAAPEIPEQADCVVWLQPRRPATPMLEAVTGALSRGTPGIIALQHFNMQARQYPGRGHAIVYWPQPQFPEIDTLWLETIGLVVPREVVFDSMRLALRAESQVYRGSARMEQAQDSAESFLVRAASANMEAPSEIVRGIGDQAFIWPSWIRLDAPALAAAGLEARALVRTSSHAWTYPWARGFLPPEVLEGPVAPPADGDDAPAPTRGSRPLVVLAEGRFGAWSPLPPDDSGVPRQGGTLAPPDPSQPASALLLIGCSEMFKDHRLTDPDFRADHLLVNAVAHLGGGPALGAIAARRPESRGFDYVPPADRLAWRTLIVGLGPVALLAGGLLRWLLLRRDRSAAARRQDGLDRRRGSPAPEVAA